MDLEALVMAVLAYMVMSCMAFIVVTGFWVLMETDKGD